MTRSAETHGALLSSFSIRSSSARPGTSALAASLVLLALGNERQLRAARSSS